MLCASAMLLFPIVWLIKRGNLNLKLTLLIIIQTLFFLFMPYTHPDPQTYFDPPKRNMDHFQVWSERTMSDYLLTRSKIVALQEFSRVVEQGVAIRNKLKIGKKFVFIDPTCIVSVKSAQVKFPDVSFTKFLTRQPSRYGYHRDLIQEARENFAGMIGEAVLISRTDFVERYLKEFSMTKIIKGEWTIFTIDPLDSENLSHLYTEYLSRK